LSKAAKVLAKVGGSLGIGSALVVGLGIPVTISAGVIVIVLICMTCWIIASNDRSARAALLITAFRGQSGSDNSQLVGRGPDALTPDASATNSNSNSKDQSLGVARPIRRPRIWRSLRDGR